MGNNVSANRVELLHGNNIYKSQVACLTQMLDTADEKLQQSNISYQLGGLNKVRPYIETNVKLLNSEIGYWMRKLNAYNENIEDIIEGLEQEIHNLEYINYENEYELSERQIRIDGMVSEIESIEYERDELKETVSELSNTCERQAAHIRKLSAECDRLDGLNIAYD